MWNQLSYLREAMDTRVGQLHPILTPQKMCQWTLE